MTSVSLPDLLVIYPLIQSCIEEKKLESRLTTDRAMDKVHELIKSGAGEVFVDDLYLPKSLLILQAGQSNVFEEMTCTVILIYVPREHRTPARVGEALTAIEQYARAKGAVTITASSWLYGASNGIGSLWEKNGFVQQEIVYVKHLK